MADCCCAPIWLLLRDCQDSLSDRPSHDDLSPGDLDTTPFHRMVSDRASDDGFPEDKVDATPFQRMVSDASTHYDRLVSDGDAQFERMVSNASTVGSLQGRKP